jgi:hypothetical protein
VERVVVEWFFRVEYENEKRYQKRLLSKRFSNFIIFSLLLYIKNIKKQKQLKVEPFNLIWRMKKTHIRQGHKHFSVGFLCVEKIFNIFDRKHFEKVYNAVGNDNFVM